MSNETSTIKIELTLLNRMLDFYHDDIVPTNEDYVVFFAKRSSLTIKAFSNKKHDSFKVFFSGYGAVSEAQMWDKTAKINEIKVKEKAYWKFLGAQIGSDEVGVGDLFGPTIVVAAYIDETNIEMLKTIGVNDSKKLTDTQIKKIAPILIENIPYHSLTMDNQKLNEMLDLGHKKLALEALMHNKCHLVLEKNIKLHDVPVYVDQFLAQDTYIRYLNGETYPTNLIFETKGESYYPSIAVASIIARFLFLQYMENLNQTYRTIFPFGANKKVDDFLQGFLLSHDIAEISKLVKKHFINFKNLEESLK